MALVWEEAPSDLETEHLHPSNHPTIIHPSIQPPSNHPAQPDTPRVWLLDLRQVCSSVTWLMRWTDATRTHGSSMHVWPIFKQLLINIKFHRTRRVPPAVFFFLGRMGVVGDDFFGLSELIQPAGFEHYPLSGWCTFTVALLEDSSVISTGLLFSGALVNLYFFLHGSWSLLSQVYVAYLSLSKSLKEC